MKPVSHVRSGCPLLSLEASLRQSRLLVQWSDADVSHAANVLGCLLHGWYGDWVAHAERYDTKVVMEVPFVHPPNDDVEGPAEEAWWTHQSMGEQPQSEEAAFPCWQLLPPAATQGSGFPGGPRDVLSQSCMELLFGVDRSDGRNPVPQDGISSKIARKAWQDLFHRLGQSLGSTQTRTAASDDESLESEFRSSRPRLPGPFHGQMNVMLPLGAAQLRLRLGVTQMRHLLRSEATPRQPKKEAGGVQASASLRSVLDIIADYEVPFDVVMLPLTVTLGQLRELRNADVLVLPQLLDQPVIMQTLGGKQIAQAWLGRHGEALAVEVVANSLGTAR